MKIHYTYIKNYNYYLQLIKRTMNDIAINYVIVDTCHSETVAWLTRTEVKTIVWQLTCNRRKKNIKKSSKLVTKTYYNKKQNASPIKASVYYKLLVNTVSSQNCAVTFASQHLDRMIV